MQYTAIPDDAPGDTSGLDFSAANRETLFQLGEQRALDGSAWLAPAVPEEATGKK
jgi:hypothetical protein